jgi:tetratricopeptide (TPR) repeat protein
MKTAILGALVVLSGNPDGPRLQAQAGSDVQVSQALGEDVQVRLQIEQAERAVQAAIAARADNRSLAEAYGRLARIHHAYELFEPAEAAYREAARLAPADGQWPHLLGYLYQQTGRLDEAMRTFGDALRLQPSNHAVTARLGQVCLGLGRLREARDLFERLRHTFPALARQGLGEVALRERRYDAAAELFLDALTRVPQATSLHYQLAMAYRGLGRVEDARTHLAQRGQGGIRIGDPIVDSLQELVRGERGLVMQGRRAYESGQYAEAAAAFARAAADAPGSATARFNLGLATLQLGDTATAITHLQAAFALDPADAQHGRELARLLLRAARPDEAIAVLRQVTAADDNDEDSLVGLSLLLAGAARFGEAVALLGGSVDRHPDRLTSATTLARLLAVAPDAALRNGQRALDLATTVYQRAAAPAHAETVAMALAELGRCSEALDWLRRGIADAERVGEVNEARRLTTELPRYETASCRRP